MANTQKLGDVIQTIAKNHGEKSLLDDNFTMAVFSDLAPTLSKERELLRAFLMCNGAQSILSIKNAPIPQQKACMDKIAKAMEEKHWVAESAARFACSEFYRGVTGKEWRDTEPVYKPTPPVRPTPATQSGNPYNSPSATQSNKKPIWIAVGVVVAIIILIFLMIPKDSIEILDGNMTIVVGETVEIEIKSTVSELRAQFSDCVETNWNNAKASGDRYYLDVTGIEEGSCTLLIKAVDKDKVYDSITINVVSPNTGSNGTQGGNEVSDHEETDPPVPEIQHLPVAAITPNPLTIDSYAESEITPVPVSFLSFTGNMGSYDQVDEFTFTAPTDGKYRFYTNGLVSGFSLGIYVYDASENRLTYTSNASNGQGTSAELTAGGTYTIKVKNASSGTGNYEVLVGQAKASVDITGVTIVNDSTEFMEQENIYYYTPAYTGKHRFYITKANAGIEVSIYVYDAAGYRVDYSTGLGQGYGVTTSLNANETYKVVVKQYDDLGAYTMNVGPQKPTTDISGYTQIVDSTKFTGQENNYTFTPTTTGKHRFQIDKINSGIEVSIYIYDDADYRVEYSTGLGQGYGVTATLEAGKTYSVVIKQYDAHGDYTMSVGSQKPYVDISGYDVVSDSIEFTNQSNKYTFTPTSSKEYAFVLADMVSDAEVSITITDAAGYQVEYYSGMSNESYLKADLEANATYTIEVKYYDNFSAYSLWIE